MLCLCMRWRLGSLLVLCCVRRLRRLVRLLILLFDLESFVTCSVCTSTLTVSAVSSVGRGPESCWEVMSLLVSLCAYAEVVDLLSTAVCGACVESGWSGVMSLVLVEDAVAAWTVADEAM